MQEKNWKNKENLRIQILLVGVFNQIFEVICIKITNLMLFNHVFKKSIE